MPKRSPTMSKDYHAQQVALHTSPKGYGARGDKWGPFVVCLLQSRPSKFRVLDYGAGQASLEKYVRAYGYDVHSYDPCYPELVGTRPEPRELVVCTDVMEHVEEEFVDDVLDELYENTLEIALIVISLVPAKKKLPDGRNAHITLKPFAWWLEKLSARFDIVEDLRLADLGDGPLRPEKELGVLCYVKKVIT